MKEAEKDLCPLFYGGKCPVCDDEWVDMGISYKEGQQINRECCKAHRQPTEDELRDMLEIKQNGDEKCTK